MFQEENAKLEDFVSYNNLKANKTYFLDGDEVVSVVAILDQKNIILKSNDGFFLRFQIEEIPEKKKAALRR